MLLVRCNPRAVLANEFGIPGNLLELGQVRLDVDEIAQMVLVSAVGHLTRHLLLLLCESGNAVMR